ncbi:MAG: DUF2254 domain-containing protein [Sphingomonadales bacterium]
MVKSKAGWLLKRTVKKVWVRVGFFALLAVATTGMAQMLAPFIPDGGKKLVGVDSVDKILEILASSMLAVTIFSLSIAVAAFSAAAATATPRATELLEQDHTTQNALATFLGAFVFSLVGIIVLKADLYTDAGRLVLFTATVVVVILVLVALLRWISLLMRFGRMGDTLDRVEKAAVKALADRVAEPYLGGRLLTAENVNDADRDGFAPVMANSVGYIQHVDMQALSDCADDMAADIQLAALPGSFVHGDAPLLWVHAAPPSDKKVRTLCAAFTFAHDRTFDQDPRFGLIVLAEIASRALSPAVNDPGTAINVIGRLVRILSTWDEPMDPPVSYPRVHVPTVGAAEMLEDAFRPIARDGASMAEVQIRLQKAFVALARLAPDVFGEPARVLSAEAATRASGGGLLDEEMRTIRALSAQTSQPADDSGQI